MRTKITSWSMPFNIKRLAAFIFVGLFTLGITNAQTFSEVTAQTTNAEFVKCKYAGWDVKFKVKNPSPNGGWIVQKITLTRDAMTCPPNPVPKNFKKEYYEAWPVAANTDTTTTTFPPAVPGKSEHNDRFLILIPNNTEGNASIKGELAFIANNAAGTSILDTANIWKKGGVNEAGSLHAVDSIVDANGKKVPYTPGFWQALTNSGKMAKHEMSVQWVCCGTKNDTIIVDTILPRLEEPVPPRDEDQSDLNQEEERQERRKMLHGANSQEQIPEIYPNPVVSGNTLSILHSENLTEVSLYNLVGENVYQRSLGGENREEISLPQVVSGYYVLLLKNRSGKLYRHKLNIINK